MGDAQVVSVSCAPGGYCAAGGYYSARGGHYQAFVVTRPKHRSRAAVDVPGLAALNSPRERTGLFGVMPGGG
jgi:hypothetical protein